MINVSTFDGPIGTIRIASTERGLCAIGFHNEGMEAFTARVEGAFGDVAVESATANGVYAEALGEYFAGRLRVFDLPLDTKGTPFQLAVWRELTNIPYGETRSYAQVAAAIGNPKACRAVGAANSRNMIPIVIPCHRVIGGSGRLVGFTGGVGFKEALLGLEGITVANGAVSKGESE